MGMAIRGLSLLLGLAFCALALAETKIYRYAPSHRSGDPRYAGEVGSGSLKGTRYRAETDAQGRLLRSATMRDGKVTSESVYRYEGDARLPSGFDNYSLGELRCRGRIQRNAQGDRVRTEFLTLDGAVTSYTVRSYTADGVEAITYAPDGKPTNRFVYTYAASGLLVRSRWHPSAETYYETEVEESTGFSKSRRKLTQGKLESRSAYAYDAEGDLIRDDIYDDKGNWYGAREYRDGLLTTERYKFLDGSTEETYTTYDERRWAKEAKFHRNGVLICTFTYDRQPNGAVKRSLAIGPGGELLAEYPNRFVNKVTRTGAMIDTPGAIIHKKGNWW